jgi:hypothetical protein
MMEGEEQNASRARLYLCGAGRNIQKETRAHTDKIWSAFRVVSHRQLRMQAIIN